MALSLYKFRILEDSEEIPVDFEVGRILPDGKQVVKTWDLTQDGLTDLEVIEYININYPIGEEL